MKTQLTECNHCNSTNFIKLFSKHDPHRNSFDIVECKDCSLVMVNPKPIQKDLDKYYGEQYFTQRTDRGYDNYYSEKIRNEVGRVFRLNLQDLDFFEFEKNYIDVKKSIDIGCAAGYFVDFMKSIGWDASGIDIAEGPTEFARKNGLNVITGNFLEWDTNFENQFGLITLWASIEHLYYPKETLIKIFKHLSKNGTLILSTCNWGILAKFHKQNWRFLNVPEHLYYYSLPLLIRQCEEIGFRYKTHITYGSGFTFKKDANIAYNFTKKIMDRVVKIMDIGDMMAIRFEK